MSDTCEKCGKRREWDAQTELLHGCTGSQPQQDGRLEWCSECQSSLGHRNYCSKFILCTRERVIALEAALAQVREALVDAQEELRLIREKDCNAVYNPLLRTVTIPLALESSRAALATQPGKATGQVAPSEPKEQ